MAKDPHVVSHTISRTASAALATALAPITIDSTNKFAATSAGARSDGTLVSTGTASGDTLSAETASAGARNVRASGTCTAGSDAAAGTSGYQDAVNGDRIVGRFLSGTTTVGDTVLMLPYEGTQGQKGANKVAFLAIAGGSGSTGVFASWANPETVSIVITRASLHIATQSTGASTLDIGTTAANATTSSDNLIDGLSAATAGAFDNVTDIGTNGKSRQLLASGKWVNVAEATGDVNGLVATLRIEYYNVS